MRRNCRSIHGDVRIGVAIALALAGCSSVNGGAVELSWKLRPASSDLTDKFVACDSGKTGTNPVTEIRLEWEVAVNGTPTIDGESWSCSDSHGVTGFALPPGPTLFRVTPLCKTGPALAASYIAPAVESRNVILGDTVSLGAVELVVQVSSCGDEMCICE